MFLMLLPHSDYDPTESGVPWAALRAAGFDVSFATPDGVPAFADERLVTRGFGPLSRLLMTRSEDLERYREMTADPAFNSPTAYGDVDVDAVEGLVIPGGHAGGVRTMLESEEAQGIAGAVLTSERPVGAVCHGVLLLARSRDTDTGRSVLHGRRTTALTASLELSAWAMTHLWLGRYYRTYPQTVQAEVTAALASPSDFVAGPRLARRDSSDRPERGFAVRDRNYVSARWPGDCHRFGAELIQAGREAIPAPVGGGRPVPYTAAG
jgi:putative intracellular protease/amidase